MSAPPQPSPVDDAALLLADVQKQALRGMVWAILCFCPIQLVFWHLVPLANRTPASLAFEATLLLGVAAQYWSLNRLSIRASGVLFVTWMSVIDVLCWVNSGPQMASAVVLVCTILVALFFVNKRTGAAVLVGFGGLIIVHAVLVGRGVLAPFALPGSSPGPVTTSRLLRLGVSSFAVMAVCYASFALIHHALFRTLARMIEERRSRDLAEAAQRRAEDTMRANQHFAALGKLASGVAHDVNNALTSVLGNAELLKQDLPAGEAQAFAQDIIGAARSAAQTTRQLLSLNRNSFCQPVSTDPAEVATSVSRLVGRLLPDQVKLVLELPGRRRILVDPADLQQALLNLLLNARDALPAGGTIVLRAEDGPAGRVRLSVSDNGTGIPAAVLPRIFDPFFTTKGAGQGTGLGLAMVRAFAEEAGGTVTATNHAGGGACFTLDLPECLLPPESAPAAAVPAIAGRSILLIEDQPDLRALMARVLARAGHRVTVVASATEALRVLATAPDFDLLCTDGILGITPLSALIDRHRHARPAAPVLLCTGHVDHELLGAGAASLQAELLRKPFTGTELLAKVHRVLAADAARGQRS